MFAIDQSLLLIIDVQEKLVPFIYQKEKVVKNIQSLIDAAHILNIPILLTEQVPFKIGPTIKEIRDKIKHINPIAKTTFSCAEEESFSRELTSSRRKQIIIVGIETHVCVYQTALDRNIPDPRLHTRLVLL